jgi:hypothetical protein
VDHRLGLTRRAGREEDVERVVEWHRKKRGKAINYQSI